VNKASDCLYGAKKAIKLASEITLDQGIEHETLLLQYIFTKKGSKEGIAAFVEKRKPNFKNL
jgi:enoyl-CoA hydratase/carnithine racemase